MKNLKRSAARYIEIENFKDYELTSCVAYEMAIRSPAFIEAIADIVSFYKKNKEEIDFFIDYYKKDQETIDYRSLLKSELLQNGFAKYKHLSQKLKEAGLFRDFEGPAFHDQIAQLDKTLFDLLSRINERCLHDELFKNGMPTLSGVFFLDQEKTLKLEDDTLVFDKHDMKDGYSVHSYAELMADMVDMEDFEDLPAQILGDDRARPELKGRITIRPFFSRPVLYGNQLESRRVSVELNLSLPINELVAYLKHIKRDQDKNPDMTAAPIELLGESLGAADYEVCMSNGKCFDARRHLSKQEKLADMFFIYDGIKAGMKKSQIIDELFDYQLDKTDDIAKTVRVDPKTLNRYYQIASEYIDGEKYKELTTGTSVKK